LNQTATEDDRLAAGSGAAGSCELFTEEYLLGAVSGAAGSCEPFTEDYLLGAASGAARSCEPATDATLSSPLSALGLEPARGSRLLRSRLPAGRLQLIFLPNR